MLIRHFSILCFASRFKFHSLCKIVNEMYPTSLFAPSPRASRSLAFLLSALLIAPLPTLAQESVAEPVATAEPAAVQEASNSPAEVLSDETAETKASEAQNASAESNEAAQEEENAEAPMFSHDLSPWGMYQNADIIVKIVMIGLAVASVITWTICLTKGLEIFIARRRLKGELLGLKKARTLREADMGFRRKGLSHYLVQETLEEVKLSADTREREGIKERAAFRLERLVASSGRNMSRGTGPLATIGSTAPFVGLFGTVWGIMNSFIGIAKSQTTNLAVVAPGIAEALLATALGLVAAIPAVVIYNVFARSISGYKAEVSDCSAEVLLLLSRELDHLPEEKGAQMHLVKRA